MRVMTPAYPQARRREAEIPSGASRRRARSSWRRRRSCAVVRTKPRRRVRHTALPSPRRRFSRRGGGSAHRWISLRKWNIAHLRAEDLDLIGNSDHAAPLGGAVVSLREFSLSLPEGESEGEGTKGCGKLGSRHRKRKTVALLPRPGSAISMSLVATRRLRARRVCVTDIPARAAKSRRGRAISPEGEAERPRTPKTFAQDPGSFLRASGQTKSGPP